MREARAADLAAVIEGGVGAMAIAAIAAMQPGPRRRLEVELWAQRIATDEACELAAAISPSTPAKELAAMIELATALDVYGWKGGR